MNILLIGSGGREHALAWKISQSPNLKKFYCAPGSDAISSLAESVPVKPEDFSAISAFCRSNKIDLAAVGPEAPLAGGIADYLKKDGIPVFGPESTSARLESSKSFAKDFMNRHRIPAAQSAVWRSPEQAFRQIKRMKFPAVLKADGLAAGKGVRICTDKEEAERTVNDFMTAHTLGNSGEAIVCEEFLTGREASIMAFCDGKTYALLPASRDHKRLLDNDLGPNTGGMGAYSPVPDIDSVLLERIRTEIFDRFIAGIKKDGLNYCGIIYAGVMISEDGPRTLEFNCRFGDPETQAVLPLLKTDIIEIMKLCAEGRLGEIKIETHEQSCACIALASEGYPEKPLTGRVISGLENIKNGDALVFHAGTKKSGADWVTAGGRVLGITARGKNHSEARDKAYKAVSLVHFEGMQYRKDIL